MAHDALRFTQRFLASALLLASSAVLAGVGDNLRAAGWLQDDKTGLVYPFSIEAWQTDASGAGLVRVNTLGATTVCTAQAADAIEDTNPYVGTQCTFGVGQSVNLDGCVADIEAAGIVRSSHPNLNYAGSTTIDVHYQKARTGDSLKITIYTPKKNIVLSGKLPPGSFMSSCSL